MRQTGIRFVHDDGSSGHRYIMEPMSAGLALFDYNDDGLTDIYFLNGAPLRGWQGTVAPRNALYRNDGGWQFTDVTDESGTGDTGFGLGVTIGDYDNDGHADIYLNNYGPNVLYHNNGDGTFSDVTAAAGANNGAFVGAGASFLDIEADGDLDLYVGNYLDFRYEDHVDLVVDGIPSYPSPRQFAAVPDTLFRNNGDGTFADISRESGVGLKAGTAMGLVSLDADNDGDTDVCVMNDVDSNFFFQNDGKGNFEEIGVLNGTAYNRFGDSVASMGVDCGDVDHDGWLDLMTTSYQDEMAVMYRNAGDGFFEDVTDVTGATGDTFAKVKWGTGLVDFDNDADLDVFIANGHTEDNIEMRGSHATYRTSNNVMENIGNAKFVDVTARAGEAMQAVHAAHGSAFGDLDEDGLVDAVLLNSRDAPLGAENRQSARAPLAGAAVARRHEQSRRRRHAGAHPGPAAATGRGAQRPELSEPLRFGAPLRPGPPGPCGAHRNPLARRLRPGPGRRSRRPAADRRARPAGAR